MLSTTKWNPDFTAGDLGPRQVQLCRGQGSNHQDQRVGLALYFLPLPLQWPGWQKLGLFGGGGGWPVLWAVLLALAEGGWNELERKMPSEAGRGLQGGCCGLRAAGGRCP